MTNLEKLEANDRREEIFARDNWTCRICGKPLRAGIPQLAHRIAATQANIKKYGREIIYHSLNMWSTCSLDCNSHCNIGNRPVERELLIDEILAAIDRGEK